MRLFAQRDLKRIVALTTVIEMNWLGMCLALGGQVGDALAVYLTVVHSITTALEFSTVEFISKRWGSRDSGQLSGLNVATPLLAAGSFVVVLITIGFPGTPLFIAKYLFLANLLTVSVGAASLVGFFFLLAVPLFFIRLWVPVWFGLPRSSSRKVTDLTSTELWLYFVLFAAALLFTFWPGLLLNA